MELLLTQGAGRSLQDRPCFVAHICAGMDGMAVNLQVKFCMLRPVYQESHTVCWSSNTSLPMQSRKTRVGRGCQFTHFETVLVVELQPHLLEVRRLFLP